MTQNMPSKSLIHTERNKSKQEMSGSCLSWLGETSFTSRGVYSIEKKVIDCFQDKETRIFICSPDLLHAWMCLNVPCLPVFNTGCVFKPSYLRAFMSTPQIYYIMLLRKVELGFSP